MEIVEEANKPYPLNKKIDQLLSSDPSVPFASSILLEALLAGTQEAHVFFSHDKQLGWAALSLQQGCILTPEQRFWLAEPSPDLNQDVPLLLTRGLHALWLARSDLRDVIDLSTVAGRELLVLWWMTKGRFKIEYSALVSAKTYWEISPFAEQDTSIPFTRGLHALWLARSDLRTAFDITTPAGRQAFIGWSQTFGKAETLFPEVNGENLDPPFGCSVNKDNFGYYREKGVNVIGYGRGEFGIGEDVRMAVRALSTTDFRFCVPNIPIKAGARMEDFSLRNYESDLPVYNVNLLCLPHYETLRLLGATRHAILDRRYNIGFWQWELPRFPEALNCAFDLVDEIWSSSSYTATAMRSATGIPVRQMPMVVEIPRMTKSWSRAMFGLPEEDFIFLTILDANSSLHRKNPLAAVRSFRRAFPHDVGVRIVIKAMNVSKDMPIWHEILKIAANDKRITIIAETMSKDKLTALQGLCDCFVSLHRAEGFGRNIAETMLLGKPVIVSNYSGNTDFTNSATAFMVNGHEIKVSEKEYFFSESQFWFDPDIETAADCMKECLENEHLRKSKSEMGRKWIEANYNSKLVGECYLKRLLAINASV